jgi:MerR family transcriptional regulator, thiopeptide resistance regulator
VAEKPPKLRREGPDLWAVSVLARLAGVTVRTLHHYDAIGLLSPRRRSGKGYRLYGADDLLRLQQILIRRELGMSLEQIHHALDQPNFDLRAALLEQRTHLEARRLRTQDMLRNIDAALAALDQPNDDDKAEKITMNVRELFDGFDPAEYEQEAEQRWGSTPAYAESARRTKSYGPNEWQQIKQEADAINRELAELLAHGAPADGEAARALAERHRLHIDRWFYPCEPSMHVGLGRMYVADDRFAVNYEKYAVGLTRYLAAAIEANAGATSHEPC